jgi:plastocyanin
MTSLTAPTATAAATLLLAATLLAGCGSSEPDAAGATEAAPAPAATSASSAPSPSAAAEPAEDAGVVVDITIEDGEATPQGDRVEAEVGQTITLNITSDAAEEIHVHSDPEHTWEVAAGESITETFSVETPGQVAVEAHHLGVTIVQLVVR